MAIKEPLATASGKGTLPGWHYAALLSHTTNLKQTLKSAIVTRNTAGSSLYESIDIEHCKALEQGDRNATYRRCLSHTLFSFYSLAACSPACLYASARSR
jgi:hypothetical protein